MSTRSPERRQDDGILHKHSGDSVLTRYARDRVNVRVGHLDNKGVC